MWRRPGRPPVLRPGAVHLWRIGLPDAPASSLIESGRSVLDDDESGRARRFHSDRLRRHFVLSHAALRHILGWYTGRPPGELTIVRGQHGKPVLHGPSSPPGAAAPQFNLTHSGNLALVAVTAGSGVGVDVERIRPLPDLNRMAARLFAPNEHARFCAIDAAARLAAFFNGWTRKEAFIKAVGEGLSRPLGSFEVTIDPAEPVRLVRVDGHTGEPARWSLHGFEPAPGYCAAVATPQVPVTFEYFDFG